MSGPHYEGRDTDFSDADRHRLQFRNNSIYSHPLIRINHTTYDFRREQDIINLKDKRDILLLSEEDDDAMDYHRFWYARVLGIYHVEVKDRYARQTTWQRFEILWVRWFGRDSGQTRVGWEGKCLDRVGYIPDEVGAFGFIDPSWVLRGIHLIPAFHGGRTTRYLSAPSEAADVENSSTDWDYYYVNRYEEFTVYIVSAY